MKNNNLDPSEYKTRDLFLATVLKKSDIPLIRLDIDNDGRGVFIFKASDEISAISFDYYNRTLKMEPLGLFDTLKSLKSIIFFRINKRNSKGEKSCLQ